MILLEIEWQFWIVVAVVGAAIAWIVFRLFIKKDSGASHCSGCSLSQACSPERKKIVAAGHRHGAKHHDHYIPECCKANRKNNV